jgi:hypothetical protein
VHFGIEAQHPCLLHEVTTNTFEASSFPPNGFTLYCMLMRVLLLDFVICIFNVCCHHFFLCLILMFRCLALREKHLGPLHVDLYRTRGLMLSACLLGGDLEGALRVRRFFIPPKLLSAPVCLSLLFFSSSTYSMIYHFENNSCLPHV